MKLVDLTRKLDAADTDRVPEAMRPWAVNIVPRIEHVRPDGEGAEVMCQIFGCTRDDLPGGEGWGDERMHISTHLGTHVDAPLHDGATCEGNPARTIDQIDVSELVVDAVVLDVRDIVRPARASPSTRSVPPSTRSAGSRPAEQRSSGRDKSGTRSLTLRSTTTRA